MVQLVFVHGVATRSGSEYDHAVANRELLFREMAFKDSTVDFWTPMWGDFVPSINPELFHTNAQVPSYSLGSGSPLATGGLGISDGMTLSATTGVSLSAFAAENPAAALDAIFTEVVGQADRDSRLLDQGDLDAFRRAVERFEAGTPDDAFAQVNSDAEISKALEEDGASSFGLVSAIGHAVSAVTDRLRNAASTVAFNTVRDDVIPAVAQFMGDVFVYLKDDHLRERIRAEIVRKMLEAHEQARKAREPLLLVGHSMGGVILVDILQKPALAGLPEDFRVSALMTVGSQPGLFQSLNVLSADPPGGVLASMPQCVDTWHNVFDPIDPLAFRAETVFAGVRDFSFDSITGLASAHTAYFKRPQFYARCRERLKGCNVI